jgi:5-methylcytosine-specific restriction endonuclease McrA
VTLGLDKGSSVTGFSAVGNGRVLLSGEIHHRRDGKEKMDARRGHRRQRRNRLRYRQPRFLNRGSSKRSGRLPPSIRTNVEEVVRVGERIPLPISRIVVEDVQVDIARLNNPTLRGRHYQDPTRLDENLRIACLMRDGYQCQHCGTRTGKRLEAHHIIHREHGGKDTLTNLITLCSSCHRKVHAGSITLNQTGMSGHFDQIAQHTMQGKTHLYERLHRIAPVSLVYGYETAAFRKALGLEKEHDSDALCIATLQTGDVVPFHRAAFWSVSFRPKRTRRQYHSLPVKGKGRVRYQVNEELHGFHKGDLVLVKGRWLKQVNSIYSSGYLAFRRVAGEPSSARPRDCRLLEKQRTIFWKKRGEHATNCHISKER